MLILGEKAKTFEEARGILEEIISSGKGIEKLKELVEAQGGNPDFVDDTSLFPRAKIIKEVLAIKKGYVKAIKADDIGIAALVLGAGRETKESTVDLAVGVVLHKKIGDFVNIGEAIATIHSNYEEKTIQAEEIIKKAYSIVDEEVFIKPLIKGIVKKDGTIRF